MTPTQESRLKKLGIFTSAQARRLGLTQQALSSLVKQERIKRIDRGIFTHPDAHLDREMEFQIACAKFGHDAAIGGLSALFYYNLAEQVPEQTWVVVPPRKITHIKNYRLIRTKTPLTEGVVEGKGYRIVSVERAVVEGLKLASKIGERTAIRAAREAIKQKLTTLPKIGKVARELGLDSYLTKYFEAIVA